MQLGGTAILHYNLILVEKRLMPCNCVSAFDKVIVSGIFIISHTGVNTEYLSIVNAIASYCCVPHITSIRLLLPL